MDNIVILIVHHDDEALLVKRRQRDDAVTDWVFPAGIAEDNPVTGAKQTAKYLLSVDSEGAQLLEETQHEQTNTGVTYVALPVASKQLSVQDEIQDTTWKNPPALDALNVDVDPRVTSYLSAQA
jgi:8-oxo-dGTP pyrophosphatase MutT (NUDIX family)